MSEVIYRLGRVADAAEILRLIWQGRTGYPLPDTYMTDPKYEAELRHQCARKSIRVAELDGRVVSVMTMLVDEVYYLAVDDGVRRRGLGRSLIALAKKRWSNLETKVRDDISQMLALIAAEDFTLYRLIFCRAPNWSGYRWSRSVTSRRDR